MKLSAALADVTVALFQRGDVAAAQEVISTSVRLGQHSAQDYFNALEKLTDEIGWVNIIKRMKEASERLRWEKDSHRPTQHGGEEQDLVDIADPGFGNPGKDFY